MREHLHPRSRARGANACVVAATLLLAIAPVRGAGLAYPWHPGPTGRASLSQRIEPPPGHERVAQPAGAFGSWLRGLPLREPGSKVRLFDGREKRSQAGVFAVVDIDVGTADLQQCADAVIRLRAEYLLQGGCEDRIVFKFTSGHPARWSEWREGLRPVVSGSRVSWARRASPDASYRSFRAYLDSVFTYAGSASLARELDVVSDPSAVMPGDVFIQGGFPGHVVLVVDVVRNRHGDRMFLLVQGYTPAQDIHVLRNPAGDGSAWYPALAKGALETPEWTFSYTDLRRFPAADCSDREDNGRAGTPGDATRRPGRTAPGRCSRLTSRRRAQREPNESPT